jgi:hypothetical protein
MSEIKRALYGNDLVLDPTAAPGATVHLPWSLNQGDALFDLDAQTSPEFPLALEAGIYCISCSVVPYEAMSAAGKNYHVVLAMATNSEDAEVDVDVYGGTDHSPEGFLSQTYYLAAGDESHVRIRNNDTIDHKFGFDVVTVQKIT